MIMETTVKMKYDSLRWISLFVLILQLIISNGWRFILLLYFIMSHSYPGLLPDKQENFCKVFSSFGPLGYVAFFSGIATLSRVFIRAILRVKQAWSAVFFKVCILPWLYGFTFKGLFMTVCHFSGPEASGLDKYWYLGEIAIFSSYVTMIFLMILVLMLLRSFHSAWKSKMRDQQENVEANTQESD